MTKLITSFIFVLLLSPVAFGQKANAANIFGQNATGTVTTVTAGNGLTVANATTTPAIDLVLNVSGGLDKTLAGTELGIAAGGVTNAMLAGSIADSKLSTIATAGKVSDSALSVNVTLLGNTTTGTGSIVRGTSPTIATATLTTPTIASFVNATHDHSNAAGGGQLTLTGLSSSIIAGTGTKLATVTGALTSGKCTEFDGNGNIVVAASNAACGSGGSGGTPSGSGTEVQIRLNSTTFSNIAGTSVSANRLTMTNGLTLSPTSTSVTPLIINIPTSPASDPLVVQSNTTAFFSATLRGTINFASRNETGSEANGDFFDSNDQKTLFYQRLGRKFYLPSVLFTSVNSINTSAASATSVVGSTGIGNRTIVTNLAVIGKHFCVDGDGYITTPGSPSTVQLDVKLGSTVIGTTGAVTPTANITNGGVQVHACFPIRAGGVGGTVQLQGYLKIIETNGTNKEYPMVNTSQTSVDFSVDELMDAFITFGSALGGQSITFTGWRYTVAN